MGLDTVEILVAFERTFEITIPDQVAYEMRTVKDAIDHIYAQVGTVRTQACRSQRAFYRLRKVIQAELGVRRTDVKPTTRWEALLPQHQRRVIWYRIKSEAGATMWPELTRSNTARVGVAALFIGGAVTGYHAAPAANEIIAAATSVASGWLGFRATRTARTQFTADNETVAHTAEYLSMHMPLAWHSDAGWTRQAVRQAVRKIVIEYLNVDPNFPDEASFVDDLGAD